MLTQLAAASGTDVDELLLDASDIDLVLTVGARFALYDIDWGNGAALRMHRAIQVLLREGSPEPERQDRHRQVLHGLAGYAPTDPEADANRYADVFDELQRHLVPSGALEFDDLRVRHWVVKQVRHMYLSNDSDVWRSALQLASAACERWDNRDELDQLTMRLFVQTANLYRALGNHQEALRLDERVLAEQRGRYGLHHSRTLIAGRGRGGDLRGLGRFEDALVEDQATFEGFREVVGNDHPNTRMAVNNLGISFLLTGDAAEALRLARSERDRRMLLFGPEDPRTWRASCQVGTCEREVGEYKRSLATLREALARIHELPTASLLDELRVHRSLAVTERRLGLTIPAKKRSTETFRGYVEHLGEDHPLTRGSLLSLAADYYRAGDAGIAVKHAMRCLRGYERKLAQGTPSPRSARSTWACSSAAWGVRPGRLVRRSRPAFAAGAAWRRAPVDAGGDDLPGRPPGHSRRTRRRAADPGGGVRERPAVPRPQSPGHRGRRREPRRDPEAAGRDPGCRHRGADRYRHRRSAWLRE
ncbi:hypothetical protein GCM10027614_02630 [Micromonospora vulcania]